MAIPKFTTFTSGAVPVEAENIDTDQIIPARFLKATERKGFRDNLFRDWRYDAEGRPIAAFPLNDPRYEGRILVSGRNFGCGSSREHAPIALLNMGAKAVIADSFARIFFRNAVNLGLVPVICKGISKKVKEGQTLTLDFVKGVVTVQETGESYPCEALGEQAMKILAAGGIKPLMRARFAKEKAEQKAE